MGNCSRLIALVALIAFAIATPYVGRAQPPELAAEQSTRLDFPSTITFELSTETETPVDSAVLRYSIAGQEYSNMAEVRFDPGTDIEIEHTVDVELNYIEPGVDVTYYWVLSSDNQPVAQTAEQSFTWIDDSFDWQRIDSQDVSVYSYDTDADFAQYILQTAQDSADKYKSEYDVPDIDPMRIWVYASGRDFASTLRQNSESWIGGYSIPAAGVIGVPIEDGDDYSVERVISHEVSHHVLYQATKNPFSYPPTWLDEGLAVTGQLAGNENDLEIVLAALEEGTLPTLRTLTSSFPTDPAAANRSYATSHMAVQFIIDQWGWEGIQGIIHGFRESLTPDQALTAALGVDTEGLDTMFRAWLEQQ